MAIFVKLFSLLFMLLLSFWKHRSLGTNWPGFKSQLFHLVTVWPWVSHISFLSCHQWHRINHACFRRWLWEWCGPARESAQHVPGTQEVRLFCSSLHRPFLLRSAPVAFCLETVTCQTPASLGPVKVFSSLEHTMSPLCASVSSTVKWENDSSYFIELLRE